MPKLKNMIPVYKKVDFVKKINESKVAEAYIEVVENIESIERSTKQCMELLSKMQDKRGIKQLNTINEMVKILKMKFQDSYPFD